MLRTNLPGRRLLDFIASAAVAIPGLVLGIGYLRTFRGFNLPFTDLPFVSFWMIIAFAFTVRRLPYAVRSCVALACSRCTCRWKKPPKTSARTTAAPFFRIVVPLMAGGILAGFVTSFLTAAVEISATLMLVSATSDAPASYGIYL